MRCSHQGKSVLAFAPGGPWIARHRQGDCYGAAHLAVRGRGERRDVQYAASVAGRGAAPRGRLARHLAGRRSPRVECGPPRWSVGARHVVRPPGAGASLGVAHPLPNRWSRSPRHEHAAGGRSSARRRGAGDGGAGARCALRHRHSGHSLPPLAVRCGTAGGRWSARLSGAGRRLVNHDQRRHSRGPERALCLLPIGPAECVCLYL
jgi:hypothetical protein